MRTRAEVERGSWLALEQLLIDLTKLACLLNTNNISVCLVLSLLLFKLQDYACIALLKKGKRFDKFN